MSTPQLTSRERKLLRMLRSQTANRILQVTRRSADEYDLVVSGRTTRGVRFVTQLRLWAVLELTNWSGPKIAKLSGNPVACAAGDRSGIVKSPKLVAIFDRFVVAPYLE